MNQDVSSALQGYIRQIEQMLDEGKSFATIANEIGTQPEILSRYYALHLRQQLQQLNKKVEQTDALAGQLEKLTRVTLPTSERRVMKQRSSAIRMLRQYGYLHQ
ncbi:hypothetical protein [Dongshaea marina]|uniref:hypothetical protein n=1 Tax=Dongshaea marina TaxID=2047966 RepID=UPI000D3E4E00|nr:hypothetical protein [Dongshaea marina]